ELAAALELAGEQLIPPVGGLLDNLVHGARVLQEAGGDREGDGRGAPREPAGGGDRLLVVTADIPLVTAAAFEDFLERCRARDAPHLRAPEERRVYGGKLRAALAQPVAQAAGAL